jgi:cell division protein FtsX
VGFFSPHSKWPFFAGIGAAIAILGIIFGWWLFAIGLIAGLTSAFGMLFEYYITDLRTRVRVEAGHH